MKRILFDRYPKMQIDVRVPVVSAKLEKVFAQPNKNYL